MSLTEVERRTIHIIRSCGDFAGASCSSKRLASTQFSREAFLEHGVSTTSQHARFPGCLDIPLQETCEAGKRVPEHADESGDGDSSIRNSEGSPNGSSGHGNSFAKSNGNDADTHQGHAREWGDGSNSISSGASRLMSSLEATPEEEGGESSDESDTTSSTDEDISDESGRSAKKRRSRKHRGLPGMDGTSVTLGSSTDSNDPGRRGGGGNGGKQVFGRQRGEIDRMPDPSVVDWEVAVVMASNSGEDMVRLTVELCGMWGGDDAPRKADLSVVMTRSWVVRRR